MSKTETRKVQVTGGGSSYIVTLPKEWVNQNKIGKNDPVHMLIQPDGTLLITTKKTVGVGQKLKKIKIDEIKDTQFLFRYLVGVYIAGFSTIEIESKSRIDQNIRETISRFRQSTIGPEIMDESVSSITIKDLINPIEMPFDKTINRMHILVKTMHEDVITALKQKDKKLAEEVIIRDSDVDRLHWLIARQVNLVNTDTMLAREMGVKPEQSTNYLIISRLLERIGDHAVRIAKNVPIVIDYGLERKILEKIASASTLSLEILSNSMKGWSNNDIMKSNETIESLKSVHTLYEEIHREAVLLQGEPPIAISYMIESIRRTGEYAVDISETTINHVVVE
ncbi:MAG: AbrB/MazE/SpoVT family DNA-binding domain-containing protein [Candidatus Helarchaeota archaeon]|nr:AbrB/MazE/SpoVT family DNA-binding domain-containing protein [Candidatus Helarchaeota archaeon]